MKKSILQLVYVATANKKERNETIKVDSCWEFIKAIWKAYRSGCDKIYIFKREL